MTRTYRAWIFTVFYFGILLFLAAVWFSLSKDESGTFQIWGLVVLVTFGIAGSPWLWAKVTINGEGIEQQIWKRHFIAWDDIVSWERSREEQSDGRETMTLHLRGGSFTLNHNCIYGKRLDEVESELKRRVLRGKPIF